MKTIYIDYDFKCHVNNDNNMTSIETDFFDNKCDAFIEGFRYIPDGEAWIREDGSIIYGEMISAWEDRDKLNKIQLEYEKSILSQLEEIYKLGVNSI